MAVHSDVWEFFDIGGSKVKCSLKESVAFVYITLYGLSFDPEGVKPQNVYKVINANGYEYSNIRSLEKTNIRL